MWGKTGHLFNLPMTENSQRSQVFLVPFFPIGDPLSFLLAHALAAPSTCRSVRPWGDLEHSMGGHVSTLLWVGFPPWFTPR